MPRLETAGRLAALAAMLVLWGAMCVPVSARAADGGDKGSHIFDVTAPKTKLTMLETSSRILQFPAKIVSVDNVDQDFIDVKTFPNIANQIRVLANTSGVSDLLVVDEFNNRYQIEINVIGDVRQLEALIRNTFPDSAVKAVKVKDAVLLTGWVNQQDQLTTIIQMAEQFHPLVLNYIKVGGVQQVMLRVKLMELERQKIRQLGFQFIEQNPNGFATSTPGSLVPLSQISMPFGTPVTPPGQPGVDILQKSLAATTATFGVFEGGNLFTGYIEALRTESLLRILAEPNLVTVHGRPANFLAGGAFPIPVSQGLGTVSIQWRDFGVELEFVPYILGAGRVRLEVAPKVSDPDYTKAVTLNGTTVPGISERRVNTQVEMNFGQTMVIGGLLKTEVISQNYKIPFLGELPYVGAAFRRVRQDQAETELLIMVTPELVAPIEPTQGPVKGPGDSSVNPTDIELFGFGFAEVPKTGDDCAGCVPGAPNGPVADWNPPMVAPPGVITDPTFGAGRPPAEKLPRPLPNPTPASQPGGPQDSSNPAPSAGSGSGKRQVGKWNRSAPSSARTIEQVSGTTPSSTGTRKSATSSRPGLIVPGTSAAKAGAPSENGNQPGLIVPR